MKGKDKQSKDRDLTVEQVIAILAEEVSAHALADHEGLKDPFDIYTHELRGKIFSHPETFKKRCLKGYRNCCL